jgi:hypothetical protein
MKSICPAGVTISSDERCPACGASPDEDCKLETVAAPSRRIVLDMVADGMPLCEAIKTVSAFGG